MQHLSSSLSLMFTFLFWGMKKLWLWFVPDFCFCFVFWTRIRFHASYFSFSLVFFFLIGSPLNKVRSQRQRLTQRLRPSVTCERFPTRSWSRSGVREGEVQRVVGGWGGGGGVSLESHARERGGNWQRNRLILCCLCSPQHAPVCVSPCPLVCQCCHASGSCAAGSGEAELDVALDSKTRQNKDAQQVCLDRVSASILRRENSEEQTCAAVVDDWHEQTWKWGELIRHG